MPMVCSYKIKVNQNKLDKVIKSVHLKAVDNLRLDESLEDIKNVVLDRTESYINAHRRRPSETSKLHIIDVLRETSYVEKIDNYTYRLSIGNKDILDNKVSYWYVLNYGGIPPDWIDGKFFGIFQDGPPIKGGKGNTWFEGGTGANGKSYLMKPKNPIPPMHYLNYMASEFSKEIKKFQVRVKK